MVSVPGYPNYANGPAIVLSPEEHATITAIQSARLLFWTSMINSGIYTQGELIDRLISQDFNLLSLTSAPFRSIGQLRGLVRSTYGR